MLLLQRRATGMATTGARADAEEVDIASALVPLAGIAQWYSSLADVFKPAQQGHQVHLNTECKPVLALAGEIEGVRWHPHLVQQYGFGQEIQHNRLLDDNGHAIHAGPSSLDGHPTRLLNYRLCCLLHLLHLCEDRAAKPIAGCKVLDVDKANKSLITGASPALFTRRHNSRAHKDDYVDINLGTSQGSKLGYHGPWIEASSLEAPRRGPLRIAKTRAAKKTKNRMTASNTNSNSESTARPAWLDEEARQAEERQTHVQSTVNNRCYPVKITLHRLVAIARRGVGVVAYHSSIPKHILSAQLAQAKGQQALHNYPTCFRQSGMCTRVAGGHMVDGDARLNAQHRKQARQDVSQRMKALREKRRRCSPNHSNNNSSTNSIGDDEDDDDDLQSNPKSGSSQTYATRSKTAPSRAAAAASRAAATLALAAAREAQVAARAAREVVAELLAPLQQLVNALDAVCD